MHQYEKCQQQVQFIQVNTSIRWRRIDDLVIWKRILGGGFQFLLNYFCYIVALMKKPDVTHLTTAGGIGIVRDLVICATARFFRVPFVYHIRFGRIPEIASKRTLEWNILSIVLRLANLVIAIDKPTSDAITSYLPSISIQHIPNPIDFSCLPAGEENVTEQNYVLFLGWIIPTKGIEELVAAWSALSPQKWLLLLAGPGKHTYRQQLIKRYKPHNLEFLEELAHDDAMQLMGRSNIFVLPSYTEGFPNAVLEAMAMGKPVIGSSVGAISEMLSENCGVLVQPKNMDDIKNALALLIQDKPLRSKLGENARKKARERYSIDAVFTEYANIWQKLAMK